MAAGKKINSSGGKSSKTCGMSLDKVVDGLSQTIESAKKLSDVFKVYGEMEKEKEKTRQAQEKTEQVKCEAFVKLAEIEAGRQERRAQNAVELLKAEGEFLNVRQQNLIKFAEQWCSILKEHPTPEFRARIYDALERLQDETINIGREPTRLQVMNYIEEIRKEAQRALNE